MTNTPGFIHWIPLPYGAFGAVLRDSIGFATISRRRLQAMSGQVGAPSLRVSVAGLRL